MPTDLSPPVPFAPDPVDLTPLRALSARAGAIRTRARLVLSSRPRSPTSRPRSRDLGVPIGPASRLGRSHPPAVRLPSETARGINRDPEPGHGAVPLPGDGIPRGRGTDDATAAPGPAARSGRAVLAAARAERADPHVRRLPHGCAGPRGPRRIQRRGFCCAPSAPPTSHRHVRSQRRATRRFRRRHPGRASLHLGNRDGGWQGLSRLAAASAIRLASLSSSSRCLCTVRSRPLQRRVAIHPCGRTGPVAVCRVRLSVRQSGIPAVHLQVLACALDSRGVCVRRAFAPLPATYLLTLGFLVFGAIGFYLAAARLFGRGAAFAGAVLLSTYTQVHGLEGAGLQQHCSGTVLRLELLACDDGAQPPRNPVGCSL